MWANGFLSEPALLRFLSFRIESFIIREGGGRTDVPMNIPSHYFSCIVYHIRSGLSREFWKNNLKVLSMTKGKTPLQEVLERGAPEYFLFHCRCAILVSSPQASAGFLSIHSTISSQGLISRLSETPSLLDFRNTFGNDSVLQCALHQYLIRWDWYSVVLPVADDTANIRGE